MIYLLKRNAEKMLFLRKLQILKDDQKRMIEIKIWNDIYTFRFLFLFCIHLKISGQQKYLRT